MNTNYQPPRGQRLPATLLDRDDQRLSTGEAFLYADSERGAFFQTSSCIQGDALQKITFLQFDGGHPISVLDIEACQVDGPAHLSFRVVS